MRMEVSGRAVCPHSLEESYPGQLSGFHDYRLSGSCNVLVCEVIRKKEWHSVQGTEAVYVPKLACLSSSRMVSRLTVFSLIQLAWLLPFPFGPQGSLFGPFLKGAPQRVLTSGPGPW